MSNEKSNKKSKAVFLIITHAVAFFAGTTFEFTQPDLKYRGWSERTEQAPQKDVSEIRVDKEVRKQANAAGEDVWAALTTNFK